MILRSQAEWLHLPLFKNRGRCTLPSLPGSLTLSHFIAPMIAFCQAQALKQTFTRFIDSLLNSSNFQLSRMHLSCANKNKKSSLLAFLPYMYMAMLERQSLTFVCCFLASTFLFSIVDYKKINLHKVWKRSQACKVFHKLNFFQYKKHKGIND